MDIQSAYALALMGRTQGPGQGPYDTRLRGYWDQTHYPAWKQFYAPNDSGLDYDYRGAFKSRVKPDSLTGHWPDTFKKPNHPTFSDQSMYSGGLFERGSAGQWKDGEYIPSPVQWPY